MSQSGILFIVSAPSGAGKTSLLRELVPADDRLVMSVSHATRAMRPGEEDGVHYHFVSVERFEELAGRGCLPRARPGVRQLLRHRRGRRCAINCGQGLDVVLEIDWQGAQQVRAALRRCACRYSSRRRVSMALRERLSGRGQDSAEIVERRMADARSELSHYPGIRLPGDQRRFRRRAWPICARLSSQNACASRARPAVSAPSWPRCLADRARNHIIARSNSNFSQAGVVDAPWPASP